MSDQPRYRIDDTSLRNRLRSSSVAPMPRKISSGETRMAPRRPIVAASMDMVDAPRPANQVAPQTLRLQPKTKLMNDFATGNRLQKSKVLVRSLHPKNSHAHATNLSQLSGVQAALPSQLPASVRQAPALPVKPRQNRSLVLKRQAVAAPVQAMAKLGKGHLVKLPRNKAQIIMTSMALLIFMVGVWVSFNTWQTNHTVKSKVAALAQQTTAASNDGTIAGNQIPDEAPPKTGSYSYQVAADMPRYISIPKLSSRKSRVLRLGVTANNELKTPANIFDTGWYDGSSKPDEAGAMLIDGHINGPSQPGVFYGLKKLVPDDIITIERGDGKILNYKVVRSQSYPKDEVDMSAALTPVIAGQKGLNLITCDGKPVAGKTFTYDHRLIVFAVQIN